MEAAKFFEQLWRQYVQLAPQAQCIHEQVERTFGTIINDHVAFRTFDRSGYTIADLEPGFLELGYQRADKYDFEDKHLLAYSYLPPHDSLPRIFLSQLLTGKLSSSAQIAIDELLKSAQPTSVSRGEPLNRLLKGRPWRLPTVEQYHLLLAESPYAAWLSVWGLCANHFTVSVHQLQPAVSLQQVVGHLQQSGILMNHSGGVIKGSPAQLLEQASTLAESQSVTLRSSINQREQEVTVGSCYYEFARRHCDAHGKLYQGFVAASASHIFESTTIGTEQ